MKNIIPTRCSLISSPAAARRRTLGALLCVAGLLALLVAAPARAGSCGGAVPCVCGDTVIANTVLSGDLNGCRDDGLRLVAGSLDCAGHQISGPGDHSDTTGVHIDGGSDIIVQNCRLRNFGDGIMVDGGTDALVRSNEIFNNMHGIWVGRSAAGTRIIENVVRDNDDEGIHLGSGTSDTLILRNQVSQSGRENIYLLRTSGNKILNNTLGVSKEPTILLKHADNNEIRSNDITDRSVVVRGDSHGNLFADNQLAAGRFTFQAFEDPDAGWTHPHTNQITGGSVLKASTCFAFDGAYDNSVSGVSVDDCRVYSEREYGDLVPYGNSVSVIGGSPCISECGAGGGAGGARRRGRIKFARRDRHDDQIRLTFTFRTTTELDPNTDDFVLEFGDADSLVFRAVVPAGSLYAHGTTLFQTRERQPSTGVDRLRLIHTATGEWRLDLKARGQFDAADRAQMTATWRIGNNEGSDDSVWTQRRRGWRLR